MWGAACEKMGSTVWNILKFIAISDGKRSVTVK